MITVDNISFNKKDISLPDLTIVGALNQYPADGTSNKQLGSTVYYVINRQFEYLSVWNSNVYMNIINVSEDGTETTLGTGNGYYDVSDVYILKFSILNTPATVNIRNADILLSGRRKSDNIHIDRLTWVSGFSSNDKAGEVSTTYIYNYGQYNKLILDSVKMANQVASTTTLGKFTVIDDETKEVLYTLSGTNIEGVEIDISDVNIIRCSTQMTTKGYYAQGLWADATLCN